MFGLRKADVPARLARLRQTLGNDYLVLEADRGYTYDPDSIGIVPGHDTADMLRVMGASGVNYDIYTDSVVSIVRYWRDSGLPSGGGWRRLARRQLPIDPAGFRLLGSSGIRLLPRCRGAGHQHGHGVGRRNAQDRQALLLVGLSP